MMKEACVHASCEDAGRPTFAIDARALSVLSITTITASVDL